MSTFARFTKLAVATGALALGLVHAQANNLFGIDVSGNQGSINWSSVYANGARFAFAKATEGAFYQDSYYKQNMTNGKAAGVQMGPYSFTHPDVDCPSTEVYYFWSFAGGTILADGKTISPALDFEVFNGHACQPSYTAWFNAYVTKLEAKTTHALHPIVLVSPCGGACDMSGSSLGQWVMEENGENLYTGAPWENCNCCNWLNPCTRQGWCFWLVTSTGSIGGVSGNCDFDAFNGTLAQLKTNFGVH